MTLSQKCPVAQEIRLGLPDHSPHDRVGSGDETVGKTVLTTDKSAMPDQIYVLFSGQSWFS